MTTEKQLPNRVNRVIFTLITVTMLIFTACSDPGDNGGPTNGGDAQTPTVTNVTVDPAMVTIMTGQTQQFSAVVTGPNNPAQTVIWTVEGGSSGTIINANGLLTVSAGETALTLTVRATSIVDTSKSGTANVTLNVPVLWAVNNLTTWADALEGITLGDNGKTHIITVSGNVVIPPTAMFDYTFGNASDITVIIQGTGTITTSANGCMLIIGNGQTVIVRDIITLQGRDNNDTSVIDIQTGGTFRMEGSAKITGNIQSTVASFAGGVRVQGGTFIMQNDAEVSGNAVASGSIQGVVRGGGVYVILNGTFIMRDNAKVNGNTASTSGLSGGASGGGVYVDSGTFIMEGGSVSNNTISVDSSMGNSYGGGVYVVNADFVMRNGTISGNTITSSTSAWGGGVYFGDFTIMHNFTMYNGTISDNTITVVSTGSGIVAARGGGVSGNLTMHDGRITGNTVIAGRTSGNNDVIAYGGGVFGQLTMSGGTISGNTVSASNDINPDMVIIYGGGVYAPGAFTKTGGTIYGNEAAANLRNTAIGGQGHAIYYLVLGSANHNWRNATAGPNNNSTRVDFWLNEVE